MKFSERVINLPPSPIRKLRPFAEHAKNEGKKVYHLNIGQPDIKTPPEMFQAIRSLNLPILEYGPSEGLDSYRKALPRYYQRYGMDVKPEDILITTAGSEAIFMALFALCNPGDEVIIPEPYYTNYNGFAQMAGVKIIPITCRIEDGFLLPPVSAFEGVITPRTRAIMICNPNNPTGALYSREALKELTSLVKRKGIFLIADEVYREFVYDGKKHTSLFHFPEVQEQTLVIDSISKRYSACGARIGAILTKNHELLKQILKLAQARLCPPTLEQLAAEAVIDLKEQYFQEVLEEYQHRRDILFKRLSSIKGVLCSKPAGAFYTVARLPIKDAEDFAVFLLRDFSYQGETVMLAPAEGFYATPGSGKDQVRIAYVLKAEDLERSMDILAEALKVYKG